MTQDRFNFVAIRRQFDFRGIEMGRWVTPKERDRAAVNFHQALHDLMDALQGPEHLISLRGTLGLQFGKGGQRGVAAHYMPATRQLALAKNAGAGSLAHEWFHAFDHYMGDKIYPHIPSSGFASYLWLNQLDQPINRLHPLSALLTECFKAIVLTPDGDEPSDLFRASQQTDEDLNILYYAKPEELCARAFEAFVEDECPNSRFLVNGSKTSKEAKAGLYPQGEQRAVINQAFRDFFYALGGALVREIS
ncbi:CLCA_X family protein [Marinomonas sp. 5E14-1]|uniref:CLCA_X family protein n=1 Tax=Marinomonas sp. 5E14-1 TaxID=3153922 RepID=UPI0032631BB8